MHLPDGKIICVHNGNRVKWFHSDGHTQTYIPKKHREYAQQLAYKRFLLEKQTECKKELYALELYQRHAVGENKKSDRFLSEDPAYQELLCPFYQMVTQEELIWSDTSYPKNPNYPEQLKYKSCKNEYVRSKSEALIAMNLYMEKIAYRYECELKIGKAVFYPDFTILHPKTNNLCYWEHFGMMENETYRENAYNKLKLYGQNGIIPSINLITTFETKSHPIDSGKIQQIVKEKFVL